MPESARPRIGRVLAEFVLIVVGVLAALAVDEYRTTSEERTQERLYLEGLAQDFERTAEDIGSVGAVYQQARRYGEAVLPVLRSDASVPLDTAAFLVAVYEITRTPEPAISRATYEDMLSTGSLRLLRTDSVRQAVVDYYESIERIIRPTDYNVDRAPYRSAVRSLLPLELQLAIRTCPLTGELAACRVAITSQPMATAVRAVLQHDGLLSHLTFSLQSAEIRSFEGAREFTASIAELLREELMGL